MSTQKLDVLLEQLNQVILGSPLATKLAVICMLAKGHLLIEDIPGVGKTTMAHALADLFGLPFKRVQFTSDLLPMRSIALHLRRKAPYCKQWKSNRCLSKVDKLIYPIRFL